jgi:sporulation protein YlmC with PRC-barrel domain
MAEKQNSTLLRLSETNLTVLDPSEDVRGLTVLDRDNEEIGQVDDLLVDDGEHKVRFLEVSSGGFLGLGARTFLIPVDAITRIHNDHIHIDQTREHVAGAPEYDPKVVRERNYYEEVYGHYGYSPYWGPGYAYPAFPLYGL